MYDVFSSINVIDSRRAQRARELSELKVRALGAKEDPYDLNSKSVIVLAYAHWEGFYNDCIDIYLFFLKSHSVKAKDAHWLMLLGILDADLNRLRDRNHSYEAKCDFVDILRSQFDKNCADFDIKCLLARSNLDFEKIKLNFRILGFDIDPFQKFRNRLDKELVAWRHSVAHGNSPELKDFAVERHVEFTSSLLLALSDVFQSKILALSP